MSLRGGHRLLHAARKLLCLGQRQPEIRDVTEVAGLLEFQNVDTPCRFVCPHLDQTHHPSHPRSPTGNGQIGHIAPELIPPLSRHSCYSCWWTAPRHRVPELGCEQPRPEPSVTQHKRIAIDLSKAVFTLHGIDQQDRPVLRTNLRRTQMIPFFAKLATTEIDRQGEGRG